MSRWSRCIARLALAAGLSLSGASQAGQLDLVAIYTTPPPSTDTAKASITSAEIEFKSADNSSWSYKFVDKDAPLARVEVSVSGLAVGWESSSTEYDFPFFYERMAHLPMAVAIGNDAATDDAIERFVAKANTLSTARDIATFVQVQQRGRRLFRLRLAEMARDPNAPRKKNDIRIAYWVIFSTNFLISNRFARIDEISKAAWDFMAEAKAAAEQPNASNDAKRLFKGTVPLEQVDDLLSTFKNREAILFNKLLQEFVLGIEGDFKASGGDLCPRIYTVSAQFQQMPEEVRSTYDGAFANQLIATRLAARCRYAALGRTTTTDADIEAARQALSDLNNSLGSMAARREFQSNIALAEQQRSLMQTALK